MSLGAVVDAADRASRRIVVTGSAGFLGWHTRVRLSTSDGVEVVPIDRAAFSGPALEVAVAHADAVLHLAGINRGSPDDVRDGNVVLADRLTHALTTTNSSARVVFAGSRQADLAGAAETPYGVGKRRAAQRIAEAAARAGRTCAEVRLPNLYGEHGRPGYNSFVATFAHRIAAGEEPTVTGDRLIPLLHVQDAVADLIAAAVDHDPPPLIRPGHVSDLRISWVRDRLARFREVYARGEIPALADAVDVSLFNTLRAAWWDQGRRTIPAAPHRDPRGSFVEVLRQHGGAGQTSFSTTVPGITRGDHFHVRKIERFQVVSGRAVIRLRRVGTDELVEIPVDGERPVAVDMPTLWTHSITNTGDGDLLTIFWISEPFDPVDPDTYPERVLR
ncbi:MAG: NAD-dependent epimerase/dehydratase family protein [Dermatophilaceae bacterium]